MSHIREIGQGISIVLLLICLLGLYFYLAGPQETQGSLSALTEDEISLEPHGNETVYFLAFARKELIEYKVANLSESLLNRTINIDLKIQGKGEAAFSLMNHTQFSRWENGSTSDEMFENFSKTQITFSPKNPWGSYVLVLQSEENYNTTVRLMKEQLFSVRIYDYEFAFNWLRIAFLTAVGSLALQFRFKSTPEHVWRRVEYSIIPKKFRAYIVGGFLHRSIMTIGLCIVGAFSIISTVFMNFRIDQTFVFVNQLWKDHMYRSCLEFILVAILMISIFMMALTVWGFSYYPILARYYPKRKLKRKHDESFINFLNKYLSSPYSFIFYLCSGVWTIFVLQTEIVVAPMLLVWLTPYFIFVGYVTTQAELKVQKTLLATPFRNLDQDFKFYKGIFGSGLILSFFVVYTLQFAIRVIDPVSQFILDHGILASHSQGSLLLSSAQVLNDITQITSVLAYLIPLCVLVTYYSIIFFIVAPPYLRKSVRNNIYHQKAVIILKDSLLDLIFFIVTFLCSTWLQSQLVPIRYEQVLISLASSFIATSFKNYLDVLRKKFA